MKKLIWLISFSLIFLMVSIIPLFNIIREYWIEHKINERYEIHHAYQGTQGFEDIVDVPELTINDMNIKIIEEKTSKKAPLTSWDQDENVPPGDIVKIHFLLNDEESSKPDEIWLSNRHRGSRYFSWLDIVMVTDRLTGEKQINIVQRLTDDNYPMEDREWKIITISQDNNVREKVLKYSGRSDNKLGVKLIDFSGTSLMSMGYYSDITKGYPSLFFPLLYPILTGMVGAVLLIISLVLFYKRRGSY
ncbi:hypothetical protein [Bacillus pseudomycoides]|uniref:hypothetical protein n=1 Tax=Bacillus pseudomycoides TaxID=64104 RepID=UPI0009868B4D|nr:hypothetical protein [Bacillus pseudomycoides]OOG89990.1 hypothetical protein BTH41_03986 [Bacillus mycoides]PEK67034.1 hypothetical protein CN590_15435 [Bacillus pseudomycoides]PEL19560.1 hypothetical protein CN608_25200 [Bacillus pseudomycoides]PGE85314.1 hypothetical protein COM55_12515 [Bacillus pseudomycoides]